MPQRLVLNHSALVLDGGNILSSTMGSARVPSTMRLLMGATGKALSMERNTSFGVPRLKRRVSPMGRTGGQNHQCAEATEGLSADSPEDGSEPDFALRATVVGAGRYKRMIFACV